MITPEKIRQLTITTSLTQQTARWFLELLDKWQKENELSDRQVAEIQALAIETARQVGISSPLAVLQAMYGASKIMVKVEQQSA